MTAPPPAAPPPEFTTGIRLPPHRLEIDEAKLLRARDAAQAHGPAGGDAERQRA